MPKTPEQRPEIRYIPVAPTQGYPYNDDEDEIDLLELVKKVWKGRFLIVKTVIVFIVLGLIVALGSPETYTSEVKLLPEAQQQSSLGGLGGLARQFGIGGEAVSTREGIPPSLYPDVIRSTAFLQQLLETDVTLSVENRRVSLQTYLLEHQEGSWLGSLQKYTIRLPFTILSGIRSIFSSDDEMVTQVDRQFADDADIRQINQMSRGQWRLIYSLRNMININESRESGIITVSVEMGDPVVVAEIADHVVTLLSEYITNYRTEKTRLDVEFIEERYQDVRNRFEEAQQELAQFTDENRGNLTAMARTREQALQSNYNLTFNLYNAMAERIEEARIKLQEETPVVNILEPAAVPISRTSPKRARLMMAYTIFGGIVGIGLIFLKHGWVAIKEKGVFED